MRRILGAALRWQALSITIFAATTALVFAQNRVQPIRPPLAAAKAAVLADGFAGASGNPDTPVPDPAIAVGPDRLVLITNAEVVIYEKTGTAIARKRLHSFFLPALVPGEASAGDVDAVFDPHTGRFFLSEAAKIQPQASCQPGTCVGHNMLAVSKTSTPESLDPSDWYLYAIDRYLERTPTGTTHTTNCGDYDKLAVNPDVLVITSKMCRESDDAGLGDNVRILDKMKLVSGQSPDTWVDLLGLTTPRGGTQFPGIEPATMFGDSPAFFMVSRTHSPCGLAIHGIDRALDAPVVTTRSVALAGDCAQYGGTRPDPRPGWVPQAGNATPLFSAQRLAKPVFRDGKLWVADTYVQRFASGPVNVIKWAELDVSRWPNDVVVTQQGTIGEDGVWNFYPALTVSAAGDVMVAFNTGSDQFYPSIRVAVRLATDPPGEMRPPVLVKAGTGAVVKLDKAGWNRFADYSDMDLDPTDSTSWFHGQFGTSGDWQTWVAKIQFTPRPE